MTIPADLRAASEELLKLQMELQRRQERNKLAQYTPYPKQALFHKEGASFRERLFLAGNQLGKTYCGGAELAIHLTGRYPKDWQGRRFDRPVRAWASSKTGEVTRDGPQRILVGEPKAAEKWGTGLIPGDTLERPIRRQGVADALDGAVIKHASGGFSTLGFKSYDQGREKWQAETLDIAWMDEEPPWDIYFEALTRTNATGGMCYITFTPLLGMSRVVKMFLESAKDGNRSLTTMTVDDALHLTPERRQEIIDSYPPHEREARTRGVPRMGSGGVFYSVNENSILCDPFAIPKHYATIGGIDFGWEHPTAAVKLAHDRDTDIVYLCAEHRKREQPPIVHAAAVKPWGPKMPWAWPQDAYQSDKRTGQTLREDYTLHGLNMLAKHATFEDGGNSVEAGIMIMLQRMMSGRFRVFKTCTEWMDEFRLYHRRDGVIFKEHDDLLDASRYAMMMLRFAQPDKDTSWKNSDLKWVV